MQFKPGDVVVTIVSDGAGQIVKLVRKVQGIQSPSVDGVNMTSGDDYWEVTPNRTFKSGSGKIVSTPMIRECHFKKQPRSINAGKATTPP